MGRKKKRFIEKDKEIKFNLVHRSQKDPLYLDDKAGEHVLVPVDDNKQANDLADRLSCLSFGGKSTLASEEKQKKLEELHKYGIYYDDEYDYMQHLREVKHNVVLEPDKLEFGELLELDKHKPKLNLPSSVFASEFEEDVGYMNQAAPDSDPKINWDPELVEILDEDTNYEFEKGNEIEDDFFVKANAELQDVEEEEEDDDDDDEEENDEEEEETDNESIKGFNGQKNDYDEFEEDESLKDFDKKSRFTSYSMTSSVIRRNANLKTLDDRFESLFAEYDDEQLGSIDTEELEGYLNPNSELFKNAIQDFEKKTKKQYYEAEPLHRIKEESETLDVDESDDDEEEEEEEEELVPVTVLEKQEIPFDCESCISRSTTKNRPVVISVKQKKIEINEKTGLPIGVLKERPVSKKQMDQLDHRITRVLLPVPERKPDETKEEKKARKQAVKEARRERRVEKKINKLQFKEEKNAQVKQLEGMKFNSVTVKLS
jgi:protein LTV1